MAGRIVKSLIVKQHEFDINTSYYNSIHKKNTLILIPHIIIVFIRRTL